MKLFKQKGGEKVTALRHEALQLVEQMPEEQMPYIIRYMRMLKNNNLGSEKLFGDKTIVTPKMKAFLELEEMLVPVSQELDYDEELAKARDEKYGYSD